MTAYRITFLASLLIAWLGTPVPAQAKNGRPKFEDTIRNVEAQFIPAEAKPGDVVVWRFKVSIVPPFHTYPTRQVDPNAFSYVTRFSWPANSSLVAEGSLTDPAGFQTKADPGEKITDLRYYEGDVVWEQRFRVADNTPAGLLSFKTTVRMTNCDEDGCIPGKLEPTATLRVAGGKSPVNSPTTNTPSGPTNNTGNASDSEYQSSLASVLSQLQKQQATRPSGLAPFLLTAMLWGGISLLTPCVFPMIPITVSFFLKQSERNHSSPLLLATVYCATIITVLGTASLTLLRTFTQLSINPIMNVFIGVLFIALALSLFGMYDLTLPTFLTRFTSSREGRGGIVGTVFMALTFTIVSFTCVAPFLGGFSGMAASGQFKTWELIMGAFAFSATFAAPFFLLALFPSLIRRLPKSGDWLHTVKIVMGFVELAAALKFFRSAELVRFSETSLFTYDLVLGMWVALAALCGLFLLKLVRIGHYDEEPGVSVPRFLVGFGFLSIALYLTPALFSGHDGGNHRPKGSIFAWIDAFLLPEGADTRLAETKWSGDLASAIAEARNERRITGQPSYIFIDFTGETCSNCRLNERNVFSRNEIKSLLKKYRLVQLYTDRVPDEFNSRMNNPKDRIQNWQLRDAEANKWFQTQAFGSEQLPLYVILEPLLDGISVVGVYNEAKINDITAFAEFLNKPFATVTTVAER